MRKRRSQKNPQKYLNVSLALAFFFISFLAVFSFYFPLRSEVAEEEPEEEEEGDEEGSNKNWKKVMKSSAREYLPIFFCVLAKE